MQFQSTCDLYDKFLDDVRVLDLPSGQQWHSYGGVQQFCGEVVTIKCIDDNSRIKEILSQEPNSEIEATSNKKILIVDGGGSTRCALLGDMIAQAAVDNGQWAGVILYGCVRDVDALKGMPIGIMAIGNTPRKSNRRDQGIVNTPINIHNVPINPNDMVFADNDGIVLLTQEQYKTI